MREKEQKHYRMSLRKRNQFRVVQFATESFLLLLFFLLLFQAENTTFHFRKLHLEMCLE